jgi:hypothetical protein
LTQTQIDILNLFNINEEGDLYISGDVIIGGNVTAYNVGGGGPINYEMLFN